MPRSGERVDRAMTRCLRMVAGMGAMPLRGLHAGSLHMRGLLFGGILVLAAWPAGASSILSLHTDIGTENSVVAISCANCPPAPELQKKRYQPPALPDSHIERSEIRQDNGTEELYRVDKFMGGSPVATVSKAQPPIVKGMLEADLKMRQEAIKAAAAEIDQLDAKVAATQAPDDRAPTMSVGIDRTAKTAAVDETAKAFDPATLKLRVD